MSDTTRPDDEQLELLVQDTPMPDIDLLVARTHKLLADGVPLTLLLDLASSPPSQALWEGEDEVSLAWLTPRGDAEEPAQDIASG